MEKARQDAPMPSTLPLVCGKIAAGKSTLCARLAAAPGAVLIEQDRWLKCLRGSTRLPPIYSRPGPGGG
jgi:predicted kinase